MDNLSLRYKCYPVDLSKSLEIRGTIHKVFSFRESNLVFLFLNKFLNVLILRSNTSFSKQEKINYRSGLLIKIYVI